MARYKIPRQVPSSINISEERFVFSDHATVHQWRQALKLIHKQIGFELRVITQMTKLADVLGIPDDVELLPRLEALASSDVVTLRRRHGKAK